MEHARLAVVLAIACGCTQTQARRAHRAGEVATAGGLIGVLVAGVAASIDQEHEETIMKVGLGFVPISLIGALVYIATDDEAAEHHATGPTLRQRNRAEAWELTQEAATAARTEDCTHVQALAPKVRELDTDFHLVVFMRDVAIQRCLRQR